MKNTYKQICLTAFLICLTVIFSFAQENARPYTCGFITKDLSELKENYQRYSHLGVQAGETVASVGASNGYVEVQLSCFVDNVNWTLQDIDTGCLNPNELEKVIAHHESLTGKKINANFEIVIGTESKTNLLLATYDRVLLVNVFHEISQPNRKDVLIDIYAALKENGFVNIMERMGTKPGQKHGDCGHIKLLEPDFVEEMKSYGFEFVAKAMPTKKSAVTFYSFKKI